MLELKKKDVLARIEREKQAEAGQKYGKVIASIQMDKSYDNSFNTQAEIAKAADVGSGTDARVESITAVMDAEGRIRELMQEWN